MVYRARYREVLEAQRLVQAEAYHDAKLFLNWTNDQEVRVTMIASNCGA